MTDDPTQRTTMAAVLDFCARARQAVPRVVADGPQVTEYDRETMARLDVPAVRRQRVATIPQHISPAAARLVATAIGMLREHIGDAILTSAPPLEAVDIGDGRASMALVLTFDVNALNAHAEEQGS